MLGNAQGCTEQFVDLVGGEYEREPAPELGKLHLLQRILLQPVILRQEFVKSTKCGEVQPDGRLGQPLGRQAHKVTPEVIRL